jgi:hypothetical protein
MALLMKAYVPIVPNVPVVPNVFNGLNTLAKCKEQRAAWRKREHLPLSALRLAIRVGGLLLGLTFTALFVLEIIPVRAERSNLC